MSLVKVTSPAATEDSCANAGPAIPSAKITPATEAEMDVFVIGDTPENTVPHIRPTRNRGETQVVRLEPLRSQLSRLG